MPIQYGRSVTIVTDGTTETSTEDIYVEAKVVKTKTIVTEQVYAKTDSDILSHFLSLLDRQKAGDVDNIGLQCIRDKKTGRIRVEKSWQV